MLLSSIINQRRRPISVTHLTSSKKRLLQKHFSVNQMPAFKGFPAASLGSRGLKVGPIPFVGTVPRAPKLPSFVSDSNLPADDVQ